MLELRQAARRAGALVLVGTSQEPIASTAAANCKHSLSILRLYLYVDRPLRLQCAAIDTTLPCDAD